MQESSPVSARRVTRGAATKAQLPAAEVIEVLANFKTADGLFVTDAQQRINYWSESAERILGIKASDALGRPCYEVLVGEDFSAQPFCKSDCPVSRNAQKRRAPRDYDVVVRDTSGRRKTINNSILLWPGAGGEHALVHLFREAKSPRRPRPVAVRQHAGRVGVSPETPPTPLSRREHEVLRLAATGLRTTEIAEALSISPYTARNQLSSVMRKLNVRSRVEAVLLATQTGLV